MGKLKKIDGCKDCSHNVSGLDGGLFCINNCIKGSEFKANVSSSAIKPPIGLMPKRHYNEKIDCERLLEVCGAISRYYNAGLKIDTEWIEEYNELVERIKSYH